MPRLTPRSAIMADRPIRGEEPIVIILGVILLS